jgi:hypothetical protein
MSSESPVNFYFLFITFEYGPSSHCSLISTHINIYFDPAKIHNLAICSSYTIRSSNKTVQSVNANSHTSGREKYCKIMKVVNKKN